MDFSFLPEAQGISELVCLPVFPYLHPPGGLPPGSVLDLVKALDPSLGQVLFLQAASSAPVSVLTGPSQMYLEVKESL